jgi:hypothetical protein
MILRARESSRAPGLDFRAFGAYKERSHLEERPVCGADCISSCPTSRAPG